MELDVVRDVLDNQILDRHKAKMGKVDGVILEVREGQQPRLAALVVGGPTLPRRLNRRLGGWAAARMRRWGARGEAFRIPVSHIIYIGHNVEVDLEAQATPVLAWEQWLREHIVRRIPGAG